MANPEHVAIVRKGIDAIRDWRRVNPEIQLDLSEADLRRLNLSPEDLLEPDVFDLVECLPGAHLENSKLQGANLTNAYLCRAILRGADLRQANLAWAYLPSADLREANLTGADMRNVDLREADLSDANLEDADLRGSFLDGTILDGANLKGANLLDVHSLWLEQVDAAVTDVTTVLPERVHPRSSSDSVDCPYYGLPPGFGGGNEDSAQSADDALLAVCRSAYNRLIDQCGGNVEAVKMGIAIELERAGFALHKDNEEIVARLNSIIATLEDGRSVQRLPSGEWLILRDYTC